MSSERRKYPRFQMQLPMHYRVLHAEGDPGKRSGKYWTRDVSLGGVRFETRENLEEDTRLSIELHLPKESFSDYVMQDPIHLDGRVAWCGKNNNQNRLFEVGVEFLALIEKEQVRIEECLRFFLDEEEWDH